MLDKEVSDLLRTLDVLNLPAFIVDRHWIILSCNDEANTFLEHDRSDVIGRNLDKFISFDNIPREGRRNSDPVPDPEASSIRSFCFRKSSGPVVTRIAVIHNHRPDRTLVVVRDIPSQKLAAEPTAPSGEASNRDLHGELINELSSIINSSLSIGTIFRMVVSELRKIINYSQGKPASF